VIAIDTDEPIITLARGYATNLSIEYVEGDFLAHDFGDTRFDYVSAVASIHHMPFVAALERAAGLLRPGGVLAVLGLFREHGVIDLAHAAVAAPVNAYFALRRAWSYSGAPVKPPEMTLPEIERAAIAVLPAVQVRRLLLWRYLLTWRHP
jgi:SAM-dependent methyltransferase